MRLSLYSSHLTWFKTFPRRRNSKEAFSSALPNFHHTWLSFQTHVACRRSSQQVGSYFAHQHPHLEVCACDRGKVKIRILNRSIQSFSKSSWLALLNRSVFSSYLKLSISTSGWTVGHPCAAPPGPWSSRAPPARMRMCHNLSVENDDGWSCRNRQVTPILFMSGVLQHCRRFGLSRFRRQCC